MSDGEVPSQSNAEVKTEEAVKIDFSRKIDC